MVAYLIQYDEAAHDLPAKGTGVLWLPATRLHNTILYAKRPLIHMAHVYSLLVHHGKPNMQLQGARY